MVLKALEGIDPKRKCYRMVGGILVERTVGAVTPTLKSSLDNVSLNCFRFNYTIIDISYTVPNVKVDV